MNSKKFCITDVPFAFYRSREGGYNLEKINRSNSGLTLILSGELEMSFQGRTQAVLPGNIILQRKGDTYSLHAPKPEGVEFIVISYMAEPEEALFELLPDRIFATEHFSRYRSAFESCARIYASHGICHEPLLCAIVQEILCNIIRENYPAVLSREKSPVEYAKRYMDEFFSNDLSSDNIAGVVGISPSYLRTLFKKAEGESPIRYLNRVRVERAKEMLASNMFRLDEIASACGFQNVYYFSRVFKSFTGVPPGKY